jgi:predicted ATPase/DNA-binding XRE family transcriptional regulator
MARGESTEAQAAPAAFGDLLRQHRFAAALTQASLAERAGLSVHAIQRLESGASRPNRGTTERLIGALTLGEKGEALFKIAAQPAPRRVQPRAPSAATLGAMTRSNVPISASRFVARAGEIERVRELVRESRLLTISGSGGCGKTRLALEVARELEGGFSDGVWLVELAPLADAALVAQTIAATVGIRDEPGRAVLDVLTDYLRSRQLLLILDNCEHLIDACAQVVDTLLRCSARVHILATSRELLGVAGEATWRVASLSVVDPRVQADGSGDLAVQVLASESGRLFVDRARLAVPSFGLIPQNAPVVAQVCRLLDGLPLAIELAAARLSMLSVEQIGARLDQCFHLLTGGSRMALRRQQTLQATIDWSYQLLSEAERSLLRRLAVFAGGWSLEAADAVCADEVRPQEDVFELLSHLVAKSMVLVEEPRENEPSVVRYRLLETIRQYAEAKLVEAGEADVARNHHLAWCLRFAAGSERALRGPERRPWLVRLDRERGNLRAALVWSIGGAGPSEVGLELANSLAYYWISDSGLVEGRDWIEKALTVTPGAAVAARTNGLNAAAWLAWRTGDAKRAAERAEQSLALCRAVGDQRGTAWALSHLAMSRDIESAVSLGEPMLHAISIFRTLSDRWATALCLYNLGVNLNRCCEYAAARQALDEAIPLFRGEQDRLMAAHVETQLGVALLAIGQTDEAEALLLRTLSVKQEEGDGRSEGYSLQWLGRLAHTREDLAGASDRYRSALKLYRDAGDRPSIAITLDLFAELALDEGQTERAARLLGAVEALRTEMKIGVAEIDRPPRERVEAVLDAALFERARGAGRATTLEQAVEYALEGHAQ